jgi:hypothetical protein
VRISHRQSNCMKVVTSAPAAYANYSAAFGSDEKIYKPTTWVETTANCKEKAGVFTFVTEKFTITTANLVFFGVGKVFIYI